MQPRCAACGKKEYRMPHILSAALGTSKTLGKPVRYYPCPSQQGIYHITTKV